MQYRAVHHKRVFTYFDSIGTSVEINTLVKINTAAQANVTREANSDIVFNGDQTVHPQNQSVDYGAKGNAHNRWDPTEKAKEKLFEQITREAGGLTAQVES